MVDIENGTKVVHMRLLSGQKEKLDTGASFRNSATAELELTEVDATFTDLLCKNPQIRNFAYFCGILTPKFSFDMAWYQYLAFIWSCVIKVGYFGSIIITIIGTQYTVSSTDLREPGDKMFFSAQILYIIQLFLMIPIMYELNWKVRRHSYLDFAKSGIFLNVQGLLKEVYILAGFYFVCLLVGMFLYKQQCQECPGYWYDLLVAVPLTLIELFIYFIMRLDYLKVNEVFKSNLIAYAAEGKLTFSRYDSMRNFVNGMIDLHFVPFSLFVFASALSCIDLLLDFALYVTMKHMKGVTYLVGFFLFVVYQGKDVFFLFSIVWTVSNINENSIILTEKLCSSQPNNDTIMIFMNQSFQPLLYKFFGLVAIYRNEFLLGLTGYTLSFIATYLNSLNKKV